MSKSIYKCTNISQIRPVGSNINVNVPVNVFSVNIKRPPASNVTNRVFRALVSH